MHWGNIGSALAGLSTVIIAVAALIRSPTAVRAWVDRQHADAEASREQAETIRLDRRRQVQGWGNGSVATYGVELVTTSEDMTTAAEELASGHPTAYVVLRVSEGGSAGVNRGHSLRQLIEKEGLISRTPTIGEREAVEAGLKALEAQGPS